ncbi:MAG: nucleotide sugar dehydrogenase [Candidatus Limnocylindrales bacterium]
MEAGAGSVQISVIGAGYVGLVTAACLAAMGHTVRCVDRDSARIATLCRGVVPFREPGLDEALATALASGRLTFSTDPATVRGTDCVFVAVGTLFADGEWSGDQVEAVVRDVAGDPLAPRTIIIRSTLLPGTMARLQQVATDIDQRVELCLNPEFTRQGSAVRDFYTPDRIVVGTSRRAEESDAVRLLARVYEPLNTSLVVTDAASAELIKVGSNAYLALKAGYANEIARIAAAIGADVATVVDAIGLDKRIGRDFLSPGPGFGGSCLPSQSRALPEIAAAHGVKVPILSAVSRSNQLHAEWVVEQLEEAVGHLEGVSVAVLGLTFKAGTDDLRESSSLTLCRRLAERGARLAVHDPLALRAGIEALAASGVDASGSTDLMTVLEGAAAVVVATEWPLYGAVDWVAARAQMSGTTVFDLRDVVDVAAITAAGLKLIVHGRAASLRAAESSSAASSTSITRP